MIYLKWLFVLVLVLVFGTIFWFTSKFFKNDNLSSTIPTDFETNLSPKILKLPVPFTAQAPTGNWEDIKQGNGCEEASILMAYSWVMNKHIDKGVARDEILKMSDYSFKRLGYFHDISNEDTIKLFKEYFKYENVILDKNVSIDNIKKYYLRGKLLLLQLTVVCWAIQIMRYPHQPITNW